MRQVGKRSIAALVIVTLASFFVMGLASTASAEKKMKSKRAQGKLMELNEAEGTMTVKEKGKKKVYQVKFEGSVLTRTTATINGKAVKLNELPLNAPVIVYWKPDEKDRKIRRARKVDAPKVPKELLDELGDNF